MRFLLTTIPDANAKPGAPPDPRLMAAIAQLSEQMTKAGKLVEAGGIGQLSTRVHLGGGKVVVTDGPFTETKEVIGGYAIVQVDSREEAIEMARKFLEVHRDILGPDFSADNDVRRIYGPWDFGPGGAPPH